MVVQFHVIHQRRLEDNDGNLVSEFLLSMLIYWQLLRDQFEWVDHHVHKIYFTFIEGVNLV